LFNQILNTHFLIIISTSSYITNFQASTGCEWERKCSGPSDAQVCGAYQLDRNYWTAAGSPGYRGAALDFERCVGDKPCAEETVTRFVNKMAFDCNLDGNVDCLDFAAIHKAGPKSCNSDWFLSSPFWTEFQQCYGFGRWSLSFVLIELITFCYSYHFHLYSKSFSILTQEYHIQKFLCHWFSWLTYFNLMFFRTFNALCLINYLFYWSLIKHTQTVC